MDSIRMPCHQRDRSMDSISELSSKKRTRINPGIKHSIPAASNVSDIETYIEDELRRLNYHPDTTRHDHYIIHKHAFDQLVEGKAVVYKSVLSNVKAEFEECIEALEKGQSQAIYLQGMVKALMVEKSTLRHFIRRGDELEEKIEKLRNLNSALRERIQVYKNERAKKIALSKTKLLRSIKKDSKQTIPGLTLEGLTDIPTLKRTLAKLKSQFNELKNSSVSKFVEKERKLTLQEKITKKEESLDNVIHINTELKERCEVLKVVVEAAKQALKNTDKDVHLYNVATKALSDYGKTKYGKQTNTLQQFISFDDDDPIKKKEAERLIEYCDHFNNLFDFGQFEAAAIHAANSPFGILRNYETLIRFKQADGAEGGQTPLLIFCDALMATANAAQPLTQAMSVECIRCALSENRLDLATHWLAQGKLSYSIPLGEVLSDNCKCPKKCTCTCLPLAQTVFMQINAHSRAAKCLSKQGKYITLLHYTKKHGNFKSEDYKNLLKSNPSSELAHLMLTTKGYKRNSSVLSFASVVSALLEGGNNNILVGVLKKLSKYDKQTLSSIINRILYETDDEIDYDKWLEVVSMCEEAGIYEVGVEILAAITIGEALNRASIAFSMDYIS